MNVLLLLCLFQGTLIDAERALHNGEWEKSIELFNHELDTKGDLMGFAGKAIINWYIHTAYDNLGDKRNSMLSLWSFKVNSEMYLRRASSESTWAKNFGVYEKLDLAEVLMEAYWASISGKSCDSTLRYCSLPEKGFLSLYALLIPFCGEESTTLKRLKNYSWRPKSIVEYGSLVVVTSTCDKKYYFKMR